MVELAVGGSPQVFYSTRRNGSTQLGATAEAISAIDLHYSKHNGRSALWSRPTPFESHDDSNMSTYPPRGGGKGRWVDRPSLIGHRDWIRYPYHESDRHVVPCV
eukprot:1021096-Rhodomonas_salina.3